jgi:hypothetical protein
MISSLKIIDRDGKLVSLYEQELVALCSKAGAENKVAGRNLRINEAYNLASKLDARGSWFCVPEIEFQFYAERHAIRE